MKPYLEFKCPKCGHDRVSYSYREGGLFGLVKERWLCSCYRCQYNWEEYQMPPVPEIKPLDLNSIFASLLKQEKP